MATFGEENVLANTDTAASETLVGCIFNLPVDGNVTNISIYITGHNADAHCKAVIYDAPADVPTNRKGFSASIDVGNETLAWYDFPVDIDLVAGDFWLGYKSDIQCHNTYVATVGVNHYKYGALNAQPYADAFPDPFGVVNTLDARLSIHADYTVGGVSKKRMLMGVGLQAKTPKFIPRKVVPWKCPLPLFP